jgi:hypothetical protein
MQSEFSSSSSYFSSPGATEFVIAE